MVNMGYEIVGIDTQQERAVCEWQQPLTPFIQLRHSLIWFTLQAENYSDFSSIFPFLQPEFFGKMDWFAYQVFALVKESFG